MNMDGEGSCICSLNAINVAKSFTTRRTYPAIRVTVATRELFSASTLMIGSVSEQTAFPNTLSNMEAENNYGTNSLPDLLAPSWKSLSPTPHHYSETMWQSPWQTGQRLETIREFACNGKFAVGTRGTVTDVHDWPGKSQPTFHVRFDGDPTPIRFTMLTASGLFRKLSPLDDLVSAILDVAREERADDAEIIIRDLILKWSIRQS